MSGINHNSSVVKLISISLEQNMNSQWRDLVELKKLVTNNVILTGQLISYLIWENDYIRPSSFKSKILKT